MPREFIEKSEGESKARAMPGVFAMSNRVGLQAAARHAFGIGAAIGKMLGSPDKMVKVSYRQVVVNDRLVKEYVQGRE